MDDLFFSADTWVPSTQCPSTQCPYSRFQAEKSSTFKSTNVSFAVSYGAGSIHGVYAKEKINLSGPSSKLTIPYQTFGLTHSARDIISSDLEMTSNGILGLGFPALTASSDTIERYDPFVFNLAAKKMITNPIFSIALNNAEGWKSELTIGGINHSRYSGQLKYVPVVKNMNSKTNELDYTFWSVQLQAIEIKEHKYKVNASVILDTGTTLSYLTKDLVDHIVQDVTQEKKLTFDIESELYLVHCNLKNSNKKVNFNFDGITISIDIQDLILPFNENQCAFGITYNFDENDRLVLGDTILRSAFFVFDMDKKQVGIATAVNSKSTVSLADL